MQKIINLIALLSGIVSLTTVAGAVYLYKNADTMIEDVRGKVIEEVTETIPKIVKGLMPNVPELPKATGDIISPVPSATGPVIPF
tara:strand:- start:440 stop:694 length:255 start_codon:yes stop_codon:yes gene_type:complete